MGCCEDKLRWVMSCARRKSLRTESRKDIEEILATRLATIMEEPESTCGEEDPTATNQRCMAKKTGKKNGSRVKKMGLFLRAAQFRFSLKDSYVLCMTGFASTRRVAGLLRY